MKKLLYGISLICAIIGIYLPVIHSASLDLNIEYRLRGVSLTNPDYNPKVRDSSSYYENRLRVTIDGSPVEHIRIVTRIQSLGLAGGSTAYTLVGGTTTARYPHTGSQPWIENAYIQLDEVSNLPLTLTIGRQPFLYGSGFIFADDELGFTAIKGTWHFTKQFTLDAFTAKISEARTGENDMDAYGIVVNSEKLRSRWMVGLFLERDRSGSKIKNVSTTLINKYFLEYYLKKDLAGAFYSVNIAVQRGSIEYTDPMAANQKYRGMKKFKVDKIFDYLKPLGFMFEGGLQSYGNDITGPMRVHAAWGVGTGDDGGTIVENEAFTPSRGHRYDGMERVGYGEFYAATLYDAYPSLPAGYTGLQIIKFGGSISPFAAVKIGIDYFIFDAQQAPPGGAKEMGRELDFSLRYPYSTYITIKASYALFFPKNGLGLESSRAERLTLAITGRF